MRNFLIVPLLAISLLGAGEIQSVLADNNVKSNVKIVLSADKPNPVSVRTIQDENMSVKANFADPGVFTDSTISNVNVVPGTSNAQILADQQKAQAEAAQKIAVASKVVAPVRNVQSVVVQPYNGSNGDVVALGQAKCNAAFGPDEWNAFYTIVQKESGWNPNAQNRHSTAYGLGQFLNSSWKGTGIAKTSDPNLQLDAVVNYIRSRYGTPSRALQFHLSHNWY